MGKRYLKWLRLWEGVCRYFAENGAVKVLGTHMSGRMLKIAKRKSVDYRRIPSLAPEKAAGLDENLMSYTVRSFFHYVEHFDKFIAGLIHFYIKVAFYFFLKSARYSSIFRQTGLEL